jgi:putative transcription factor
VQCALCGKEAKLVKARVEGAVIEVCEDCVKFGERIFEPVYKPVKRKVKLDFEEKEIVERYGKRVLEARNEKGLSREELAKLLGEKESVIRRIEEEEMIPDSELAKKIESKLGIKLFEEYKGEARKVKSKKVPELTLGDVVEVK